MQSDRLDPGLLQYHTPWSLSYLSCRWSRIPTVRCYEVVWKSTPKCHDFPDEHCDAILGCHYLHILDTLKFWGIFGVGASIGIPCLKLPSGTGPRSGSCEWAGPGWFHPRIASSIRRERWNMGHWWILLASWNRRAVVPKRKIYIISKTEHLGLKWLEAHW